MKILLINDNPVVNKLVTLSAQKTSDDLESVENIDDISLDKYDLLVVDDTLYSIEVMNDLKNKIKFDKSLYICAKDADEIDEFTRVLKKPFLPTDLVEMFSFLGKDANAVDIDDADEEEVANEEFDEIKSGDELEDFNLDEATEVGELEDLEDFNLDLGAELDSLDPEETEELSDEDLDENSLALEDMELDNIDITDLNEMEDTKLEDPIDSELSEDLDELDDLNLDDLDLGDETSPVLDKEEVQEVQDLLEEVNLEATENSLNESSESSEVNELEDLSLEPDLDSDLKDMDIGIHDFDLSMDESENIEEVDSAEPADSLESDEVQSLEEANIGIDDFDLSADEELSLETDEELELELDSGEELSLETDEELELELDSDEELSLETDEELELDSDEELSLEADEEVELDSDEELSLETDEELELELDSDEELKLDELDLEEENLEELIETAEEELTQEDLESEVSLDEFGTLTTNEIKIALGEEVTVETPIEPEISTEVNELEEFSLESDSGLDEAEGKELEIPTSTQISTNQDGVEALKKLLDALSNEDVAASMKGMKVNINFELGDK